MFSVIDFETTGFSPARGGRAVEIGIVNLDENGRKVSEFTSIINPGDVFGATHIHKLPPKVLRNAPKFEDIAGEVLEALEATTVLAAHNLAFDVEFLYSEFQQVGIRIPLLPGVCTMEMSGGGALFDCCKKFEIPLDASIQFHSALDDARATAGLLSYFLSLKGSFTTSLTGWPRLPITSRKSISRQAAFELSTQEVQSSHDFDSIVAKAIQVVSESTQPAVCFTGELTAEVNGHVLNRKQIEEYCAGRGFQVKKSMSNKVDILVEEEHEWVTRKSEQARELGKLILPPAAFAKVLEHMLPSA